MNEVRSQSPDGAWKGRGEVIVGTLWPRRHPGDRDPVDLAMRGQQSARVGSQDLDLQTRLEKPPAHFVHMGLDTTDGRKETRGDDEDAEWCRFGRRCLTLHHLS